MNSQTVAIWVQVLTGIAVLIGLGLVVWELQQARELTLVQMGQGSMSDITQDFSAQYSEGASRALARACFLPKDLTEEDSVVLDMIFQVRMLKGYRLKLQTDIAGFEAPWEQVTNFGISYIKGFTHGSAWLDAYVSSDPAFNQYVQGVFKNVDPTPCTDKLSIFLSKPPNDEDV